MHLAAPWGDLRTSSKAVSTGERRGNPTKEQHVQKNQQGQQSPQQGNHSQSRQQSQQSQSGSQQQQGGHGKLTPSGGSNQQSQSGGSRDQQGSNLKSDHGQAQSRNLQQGGDSSDRSNRR
jgi:hypothetical protein